jgi:hypothetical protein
MTNNKQYNVIDLIWEKVPITELDIKNPPSDNNLIILPYTRFMVTM